LWDLDGLSVLAETRLPSNGVGIGPTTYEQVVGAFDAELGTLLRMLLMLPHRGLTQVKGPARASLKFRAMDFGVASSIYSIVTRPLPTKTKVWAANGPPASGPKVKVMVFVEALATTSIGEPIRKGTFESVTVPESDAVVPSVVPDAGQ